MDRTVFDVCGESDGLGHEVALQNVSYPGDSPFAETATDGARDTLHGREGEVAPAPSAPEHALTLGNTPAFRYTYDVAGRMLTTVNRSDTLTWTYNLAGELLSEQSAANASTVAYTYDANGNLQTKVEGGDTWVPASPSRWSVVFAVVSRSRRRGRKRRVLWRERSRCGRISSPIVVWVGLSFLVG